MNAPDWKPAITPYDGERQMLYNGLIDATLLSLLYRGSPRDPAIAEDTLQALPAPGAFDDCEVAPVRSSLRRPEPKIANSPDRSLAKIVCAAGCAWSREEVLRVVESVEKLGTDFNPSTAI
jgi:hypothetical protein